MKISRGNGQSKIFVILKHWPLAPIELFLAVAEVRKVLLKGLTVSNGVSFISFSGLLVMHECEFFANINKEETELAWWVEKIEGNVEMPTRVVQFNGFFERPETINYSWIFIVAQMLIEACQITLSDRRKRIHFFELLTNSNRSL